VLALAGEVAGARVLDAGCGPGFYAEELLARGAEVVAVDFSEPMLELARKRLGPSIDVRRVDLRDALPFADAEFDLIVCPLVLHHLEDRLQPLREFHRVLRAGGLHFVISDVFADPGSGSTNRSMRKPASPIAAHSDVRGSRQ